jgi:hypothetical protein
MLALSVPFILLISCILQALGFNNFETSLRLGVKSLLPVNDAESPQRGVDVVGVELNSEAFSARPFSSDECGAAAGESI